MKDKERDEAEELVVEAALLFCDALEAERLEAFLEGPAAQYRRAAAERAVIEARWRIEERVRRLKACMEP